jgi:hypothetical protein
MFPLVKRCTDNLITELSEKAHSERSFNVAEYVCMHVISLVQLLCSCSYHFFSFSIFGSFALQTILATIFGCTVDIMGDEWNELSKCVHTYVEGYKEGEFEKFVLLDSEYIISSLSH